MSEFRTVFHIDEIIDMDGGVYYKIRFPAIWPHRSVLIDTNLLPTQLFQLLDTSPGLADGYSVYGHARANLDAPDSYTLDLKAPFEFDLGYWEDDDSEPITGQRWISHDRIKVDG